MGHCTSMHPLHGSFQINVQEAIITCIILGYEILGNGLVFLYPDPGKLLAHFGVNALFWNPTYKQNEESQYRSTDIFTGDPLL